MFSPYKGLAVLHTTLTSDVTSGNSVLLANVESITLVVLQYNNLSYFPYRGVGLPTRSCVQWRIKWERTKELGTFIQLLLYGCYSGLNLLCVGISPV